MLMRIYNAYSNWLLSSTERLRVRSLARAIRRGRLTPEMAQNRLDFIQSIKRVYPAQFAVSVIYLIYLGLMAAQIVPMGVLQPLIMAIFMFSIAVWLLPKTLHYGRIERRLRRTAIVEGRLKPRFPDRLWARAQQIP